MERHPYLDGPFPRAYAHRGWHLDDLTGCENTLAAFHRAVDEGFGYLELDVHASTDGVVFVHHDPTLERTTDGHGRIGALSAAAIAEVKVRGREPIPRLEQVLTELPDTRITIELKSDAVVAPLLGVLERTDAWHRVCVGGFDAAWIDRLSTLSDSDAVAELAACESEARAFARDGIKVLLENSAATHTACLQLREDYLQACWQEARDHALRHYVKERDLDEVITELEAHHVADVQQRQAELINNSFEFAAGR